jgi:hypothetical protein
VGLDCYLEPELVWGYWTSIGGRLTDHFVLEKFSENGLRIKYSLLLLLSDSLGVVILSFHYALDVSCGAPGDYAYFSWRIPGLNQEILM